MPEEERISPAVVIGGGLLLGLGATAAVAAIALAALPTPPGAEFKVSDLIISPAEVTPEQIVTISCTVTNIGTEAGTYTVHLGGDFVAEQIVELAPGESKTIAFEVTPTVPKTYNVSVDGLTGTFSVVGVADIRVENLVISPAEVLIGEKVTISCQATNYGTATGSKAITCLVS